MRRVLKKFGIVLFGISVTLVFCEFLIYYVVIIQCSWPSLNENSNNDNTLKALILADTHLLGPRKGHWLDKLRREWQMHRAFQAIVRVHDPEVVFVLGDLFDEGEWVDHDRFKEYVDRFHSLFAVPEHMKMYIVPGNHDIGFHQVTRPVLVKRFSELLNVTSVQLLTLKGSHFVLFNSIALYGDSCQICTEAKTLLNEISAKLQCSQNPKCRQTEKKLNYSKPIIMQHFPLYRTSDEICSGPNLAPEAERSIPFRSTIDSLSKKSTEFLLQKIAPRAIFSAHTHHGCLLRHRQMIDQEEIQPYEYSVPSFSWRNRPEPKYMLVKFTPDTYAVQNCDLPTEAAIVISAVILLSITAFYVKTIRSIGKCRQ